jgi:hypothetical protein
VLLSLREGSVLYISQYCSTVVQTGDDVTYAHSTRTGRNSSRHQQSKNTGASSQTDCEAPVSMCQSSRPFPSSLEQPVHSPSLHITHSNVQHYGTSTSSNRPVHSGKESGHWSLWQGASRTSDPLDTLTVCSARFLADDVTVAEMTGR